MFTFLKASRWFIGIILVVILIGILGATIPLVSTVNVLTDKDNPKQWLDQANLYSTISDQVITQVISESEKSADNGFGVLPIEERERILKITFSADWLEKETEKNIDLLYDWFEGNEDDPSFSLDFSGKDEVLKNELIGSLKKQFALLPQCEEGTDTGDHYSYVDDGCIPTSVDITEINQKIDAQIPDEEILSETALTLNKDSISSTTTKRVNLMYTWGKSSFLTFWILLIVFSAIILLIIPGWTKGLVLLGTTFIMIGLLWAVSSTLIYNGFDNFYERLTDNLFKETSSESFAEVESTLVDELIRESVQIAFKDVLSQIRFLSILIVILGIIFILARFVIRSQQKKKSLTAGNIKISHNI